MAPGRLDGVRSPAPAAREAPSRGQGSEWCWVWVRGLRGLRHPGLGFKVGSGLQGQSAADCSLECRLQSFFAAG